MKARLISRETQAASAAARWMDQYMWDGKWRDPRALRFSAKDVYHRLIALGPHPSPDEVDAVVGNTSWTDTPSCDGCGSEGMPVVQVGQEPDYESSTATLCRACLLDATRVASTARRPARGD